MSKISLSNLTDTALPSDLSILRAQLRRIHKQQLELLNIMMDTGPIIMGSVYQAYRTCSYPNCRCHHGQKHGPFPSISFSFQGKNKSRPIRRADVQEVQQKAAAYKRFQTAFAQWRSQNIQEERILEKIRLLSAEPYQ
jgi:hypothetical protein